MLCKPVSLQATEEEEDESLIVIFTLTVALKALSKRMSSSFQTLMTLKIKQTRRIAKLHLKEPVEL